MRRIGWLFCVLAVLVLGTGVLAGADKGSGKGRQKRGGRDLPAGFNKLDLTAEQIQKIKEIRSKNRPKLADLRQQLAQTLKAEQQEIQGVLTENQKTKLPEVRVQAKEAAKAKVKTKGKGRNRSKDSPPRDRKIEGKKTEEKKSNGEKKSEEKK